MTDEDRHDETDTASALQTIVGGAGWVFGGRIAKLTLLFTVEIAMARILGTTGYGGVVLASMVISIGGMIGGLGMGTGLSRNVPHYEDDPEQARGVLRAGVGTSLVGGIVVGVAVFAFAPQLAVHVFQDPDLEPLFRIAAIGIPVGILSSNGIAIAKGSRDAKTHVAIKQVFKPTAQFVFVVGFVLLGYEAAGAMAGKVIASSLGAIGALWLAYRYLRFPLWGPTEPKYREMLRFSLPLLFASGMGFLISNTDTFLIGTFLSSDRVGVYNSAFQLKQLGMVFFFPATFLVTPVFSRLDRNAETEDARRTYQLVTKWMTFASLPLVLLLFLFPEVVIATSFGAEYTDAAIVLQLLSVAIFVTVLLGANGMTLIALGHTNIQMYVNGGLAGLNVVLNVLLIPPFGIAGAGVASMIALVSRDLLYTVALYEWHDIQPLTWPLLKPLAVVGVLVPVGYLAFVGLFPVTVLSVAVLGAVGLVPYAVIVVVTGGFEADDAQIAAQIESNAGVDLGALRTVIHRLSH